MKKILIFTEGGKDIGFGHITRCLSLYQAFEESVYPARLIVNGDETTANISSAVSAEVFDWIANEERFDDLLEGAHIAIIDSYLAKKEIYRKISERAEIAVYIDDNMRMDYPAGVVINGAIFAEEMAYPRSKDVTYMLGVKYIPIRKEFWTAEDKKPGGDIGSIMITFGGDDATNTTPRILKALIEKYPDAIKKVVIGRAFEHKEDIERLKGDNVELIYHPDAALMKTIMASSDIAVSAGGQTLYELARMGLPTIAVMVVDNQAANMKGWAKSGFIEDAGWWKDGDLAGRVLSSVEKLRSKEERIHKGSLGRKFVDGQGSRRITKELLRF